MAYQNRGSFLAFDRYVLHLESNDRVLLDHETWVVFGRESAVLRILHIVGDLGVRDERLAGADLDLNADLFDAGNDAVEDFAFERSVDHRLEADSEDRVTVVVDLAFFDALESRQSSLLEDRDEVSVLYVAGAQHAVQSRQPRLLVVDVVRQRWPQRFWRHDDVLLYFHQKEHLFCLLI